MMKTPSTISVTNEKARRSACRQREASARALDVNIPGGCARLKPGMLPVADAQLHGFAWSNSLGHLLAQLAADPAQITTKPTNAPEAAWLVRNSWSSEPSIDSVPGAMSFGRTSAGAWNAERSRRAKARVAVKGVDGNSDP